MARTEGDEWRAVYDYTAEYPECKKGVYSILVTMFQPQRYFAMVLDSNENQNNTHIICIK